MTVEENRGSLRSENDRFPVGMRVLAVDDDPTCLMLLEGLLRKCQYQVTTTSQAKMALKMLRENRNRFDLVISDVHMPDMDGFKLLEHLGLEMDLPVIMLSANSDPKLVMKGITHGACDYLVKPVRIEELRNIWQHVIRRKKSSTEDKAHQGNGEGRQELGPTGNADQNGKSNRKRKDEEDEGGEENGNESEDAGTQKKPRVVWSIELHRKFVAAVNQLGIEKAVPKRILDLMNVEGITRENVASHLQKYRLYLKRISTVASQQANLVAAFGGKDSSYMRISSLDGYGDFRTMSGPGRLSNSALSSYQTGGMLGRLNSPAGVSIRSLSPSTVIQPSHAQNMSNSIANLGKLQPAVLPENQNTSLFQGIATPLELGQLQRSSSLPGASSDSLILQGNSQQAPNGVIGNLSSFKMPSLSSEPLNTGFSGPNFLDNSRCNENWQSTVQLSNFSSNPLPLSEPFNHDRLLPNSMRNNNSSSGPLNHISPLLLSSANTISVPVEDSQGDIQCQTGLIGDVRNVNQASDQRWGEKQNYTQDHCFSTLNSIAPVNGVVGPFSQSFDQNNGVFDRKIDASVVSQTNSSASTLLQLREIEKSVMDSKMRPNEDYLFEQTKSQGGFGHNGYDSLDDLMSAMIKREQDGTTMLMDGGFGIDAYSFGSCL